jgi:hypothetical protein
MSIFVIQQWSTVASELSQIAIAGYFVSEIAKRLTVIFAWWAMLIPFPSDRAITESAKKRHELSAKITVCPIRWNSQCEIWTISHARKLAAPPSQFRTTQRSTTTLRVWTAESAWL